jgi:Protein of unknown function (DUF3102)
MSKYSGSPQDASRQQHGDPPFDHSNSLADLAVRIDAAHAQVVAATHSALEHAMAAGDMLKEAQDSVVGRHGHWENWVKKNCNIPPRTASRYMLLAKHRETIKAKSATVADLTVRAAERLLKPKNKGIPRPRNKPVDKSVFALSSLTWSDAPVLARTSFVNGVGLQALYEAAPTNSQRQFRDWLLQQEQLPVDEQVRTETWPHIPGDLGIPDFLKREGAHA